MSTHHQSIAAPRISVTNAKDGVPQQLDISIYALIIAAWAGRDQDVLEKHIHELEEMGVTRPPRTPVFYRVSNSLLTTTPSMEVIGQDSTGEVECVLLNHDGNLFVGVGSDHTDRKAEAIGITLSKQMCPKAVSREVWAFAEVEPHWDSLILRSYAVFDAKRILYQEGNVSGLRHPRNLLELYARQNSGSFSAGSAMFCGTLAAREKIRWSPSFEMELEDPVLRRKISHRYEIHALPIEG